MQILKYYYKDTLCSVIKFSTPLNPIIVENHVTDVVRQAFGNIENPTWKDFEEFLESRCFPKTRYNAKELLKELDIEFYDPLQIVKKTQGKMADDAHWLIIEDEDSL